MGTTVVRFSNLDLNLLVALNVLIEEKKVSRSADRLFVTPSAMSGMLERLREFFDDDLLVQRGRVMELTPRAESLKQPVHQVLAYVKESIMMAPLFEPKACERSFTIMASDYILSTFLTQKLAVLASLAPKMTFSLQRPVDPPGSAIESGEADLLITLENAASAKHPTRIAFRDHFVALVSSTQAFANDILDMESYLALGHVVPSFGRVHPLGIEEAMMRDLDISRRIEILAPSVMSVPSLIVGTNRISTIQARVAHTVEAFLPLKAMRLPFELPEIVEVIQWHSARSNDQALMWVIDQLSCPPEPVTMPLPALCEQD
ncbi:MAG: LysR family transcriptional regulator [Asticcacaulis sp.]|uniref:LysR family transcriptional regulator n=1 Tax=Asticcacaulis sp. TaxID=1872648 RepID=UPI0039E65A78